MSVTICALCIFDIVWHCMVLNIILYFILSSIQWIFLLINSFHQSVIFCALYINQWCYIHLRSCFLRRQLKFTVRNLYNEKPKPIKFLQVVSTSWFPQSCQSFTSPLQKLIKFPVGIQSKPQDRCVSFCLDSSSQDSNQGAFATNICLPVCFFFSALFHIFFFFDFYISY